jgi:hypothetical protein
MQGRFPCFVLKIMYIAQNFYQLTYVPMDNTNHDYELNRAFGMLHNLGSQIKECGKLYEGGLKQEGDQKAYEIFAAALSIACNGTKHLMARQMDDIKTELA